MGGTWKNQSKNETPRSGVFGSFLATYFLYHFIIGINSKIIFMIKKVMEDIFSLRVVR